MSLWREYVHLYGAFERGKRREPTKNNRDDEAVWQREADKKRSVWRERGKNGLKSRQLPFLENGQPSVEGVLGERPQAKK